MKISTSLCMMTALLACFGAPAHAAAQPKPSIVLVHGALIDGSAWRGVYDVLTRDGYHVSIVQQPLTGLDEDVAATRRVLDQQSGPVVLVGHSYGGAIITVAGADPKVKALVYVAAFAPQEGESVCDIEKQDAVPEYMALLDCDAAGFLRLRWHAIPSHLAQDLPLVNARVLAASQQPIRATALAERVDRCAWRDRASWYLVATLDRMLAPSLQRSMAARMEARVVEIAASHLPLISRPKEVTAIILDAVACARGDEA